MFGISGEHLLVLGIVLLIFGPRRLPELGNTLGKAIRNFKDAISGVEEAKFKRLGEETPVSPVQVNEQPQAEAQTQFQPQSSQIKTPSQNNQPDVSV